MILTYLSFGPRVKVPEERGRGERVKMREEKGAMVKEWHERLGERVGEKTRKDRICDDTAVH